MIEPGIGYITRFGIWACVSSDDSCAARAVWLRVRTPVPWGRFSSRGNAWPPPDHPSRARRSCRVLSSAHRFLDQRADPLLIGSGQLRQCELGWPHAAFVELGLVAEAERRIPALELVRALEETDDLAILGIRGHPIPGSR